MQSFARDGCGLPAQSAESAGYHLEQSRRRSERLDTAEHSPVQFKTVHAGTTVEAFGTFTLAICMGSCSSDRRDPSISLRYTRDDRTIHNYSARSCCHVERRAAGPQSRHPNVPEFLPLRFAWVHACSTLGTPRQARGDKKTHVFCYKSGKMYYLWDKRSAGKARFALPLTVNVRNLPV